jgi:hypothetical protein
MTGDTDEFDLRQILDHEVGDAAAELTTGEDASGELGFPGLETIAVYIATKIVVPVVASFISREVWERYNDLRTRRRADDALRELSERGLTPLTPPDETLRRQVRDALILSLATEGLAAATAEVLADRVMARVAQQVAQPPSPSPA